MNISYVNIGRLKKAYRDKYQNSDSSIQVNDVDIEYQHVEEYALIERKDNQIIIKIPDTIETEDLQDFVDYIRYKELTSDINIPQEKIDRLASDINKSWWKRNRAQFFR